MTTGERTTSGRQPDDRGATFIIFVMMISALLLIVAIVLDLGQARTDDKNNDVAADRAALAATTDIAKSGNPRLACQTGWAYFKVNAGFSAADVVSSPNCNDFGDTCGVRPASPPTGVLADGTTVQFIYPVSETDPLMTKKAGATTDGTDPCMRFGVAVASSTDFKFAEGSADLESYAVAMATTSAAAGTSITAPLILLNESGCDVIRIEGSAKVIADSTASIPGQIIVDSSGSSCAGSESVINLRPGDGDLIAKPAGSTPGVISSGALGDGQPEARAYAYPSHYGENRKVPRPTAGTSQQGRAAADSLEDTYGPHLTTDIQPLLSGSPPPGTDYVWSQFVRENSQESDKRLKCKYDRGGMSSDGVPRDGSPYPIRLPPGNWYIDCPNGLTLGGDGLVMFQGGNVVLEKPLHLSGSVPVLFNCPKMVSKKGHPWASEGASQATQCGTPWGPSNIVVRHGTLFTGSDTNSVVLPQTFVYVADGSPISMNNGAKSLYWTAPDTGHFNGLALWSVPASGTNTMSLLGDRGIDLKGVFYSPKSRLNVGGSRHLEQTGTQLFLDSVYAHGSGVLSVAPHTNSPITSTTQSSDGVRLIR